MSCAGCIERGQGELKFKNKVAQTLNIVLTLRIEVRSQVLIEGEGFRIEKKVTDSNVGDKRPQKVAPHNFQSFPFLFCLSASERWSCVKR